MREASGRSLRQVRRFFPEIAALVKILLKALLQTRPEVHGRLEVRPETHP